MIFSAQTSRWQTVIADLSLILFLVAASALESGPAPLAKAAPAAALEEPIDIALTVWSDVPGAPTLGEWLAEQAADDSQRLSITVTYPAGGLESALARISAVRLQSGTAGADARILIAEGADISIQVRLVQDDAQMPSGPDIAS